MANLPNLERDVEDLETKEFILKHFDKNLS